MELTSDIDVRVNELCGSDLNIVRAARVSVLGAGVLAGEREKLEDRRCLINYLINHKHSSPFAHGYLSFFVRAPIFVMREMQRHKSLEFNEESGRYKELEPRFWVPRLDRKMTPAVNYKSARPEFVETSPQAYDALILEMRHAYAAAYSSYKMALAAGIAREVARSVLPVGTYSSCWVSGSPLSFLRFLSLRTQDERANHPSFPQAEIQEVAQRFEETLAEYWPLTHEAWNRFGREAL